MNHWHLYQQNLQELSVLGEIGAQLYILKIDKLWITLYVYWENHGILRQVM